jgi:hypothetical protein
MVKKAINTMKYINWIKCSAKMPINEQRVVVLMDNGEICDAYRDDGWIYGFKKHLDQLGKDDCGLSFLPLKTNTWVSLSHPVIAWVPYKGV